jgi:hypothetical protein
MPTTKVLELPDTISPEWLEIVRCKVEGLRYGIVQIVVHDNHVTQIEKTEKTRLDSPKPEAAFPRRENT